MLRALGLGGDDHHSNQLDMKVEIFNPSDQNHLNWIDAQIKDFNAARDRLLDFDRKLVMAGSANTLLWLSGMMGGWGPYIAAAGYIAISIAAGTYYGRDKLQKEFTESLNHLYQVYRWAGEKQSVGITRHPQGIKLVESLIPFTQDWRELILWNLTEVRREDVSPRFIELFMQSPHRVAILLGGQQDNSILSNMLRRNTHAPNQVVVLEDPRETIIKNKWYQFFARTAADAKLTWYGHQFKSEESEAAQKPVLK